MAKVYSMGRPSQAAMEQNFPQNLQKNGESRSKHVQRVHVSARMHVCVRLTVNKLYKDNEGLFLTSLDGEQPNLNSLIADRTGSDQIKSCGSN